MFSHTRSRHAAMPVATTRDLVVFNYRRAVRARQVMLCEGAGSVWLVELLDPQSGIWIWQSESRDGEIALDYAKRLSLMLS